MKERKSNTKYFKVFYWHCFILNNDKNKLGKFDKKSDEDIFIGYSYISGAYKVCNLKTSTIDE